MPIDRRTFLLLIAAAVATGVTGGAAAQENRCHECGTPIVRGSRAHRLADLGEYPEDHLCAICLATKMRRVENEERVRVAIWEPNLQYDHLFVPKSVYLNRKHHMRLVNQGPASVADILAGARLQVQLRRPSQSKT